MAAEEEPNAARLLGGYHYNVENRDQEERVDEFADPFPAIMGQNDSRRMRLRMRDWQWDALDIKEAIEGSDDSEEDPEVDNLNDFWYTQLAIVCEDERNNEDALRRAHALQVFRQEYDILDTYQDGCNRLRRCVGLFPRLWLSFEFQEEHGHYARVQDGVALDVTVLNTQAKVKDFFAGFYYTYHALNPDLESIRKGSVVIIECQGMDWTKKKELKLWQQLFSQLLSCYPMKSQARLYHTGSIMNIMVSMVKPLMPEDTQNYIQVGLQCDNRLDTLYHMPDVESANEWMLLRIEASLKRRYENERTFRINPNWM